MKVDVIAITISSPLQIGIYEDKKLIKSIINDGKTSDVLAPVFEKILEEYSVDKIFYTKGPGSFMAIKLGYVFLQTLCMTKDIKLFASDAFLFNNNSPIKGIGKTCFVKKEDGEIVIEKTESFENTSFVLSEVLDYEKFSEEVEPLYVAAAV
ncbi:MAG: hypothetical protein OIF32_01180 [Campylobacterales bacterium]|nr:hypothetical protein [Campylobacterales bacterium]